LLSNVVGGLLFFSLAGAALGPGVAILLILLAGGLGNALNACLRDTYFSVGASTAVFASIGLLAGVRVLQPAARAPRGAVWRPIAAGVALLALLGSSRESDVLAHAFGFVAGMGLGLAAGRLDRPAGRPVLQLAAFAGAVLVVAVAWRSILR
jgi:hypothetical protein